MTTDIVFNDPSPSQLVWQSVDSDLCQLVVKESRARIESYKAKPGDVEEHAGIEAFLVEGGYHEKQVYELVQNAADALARNPGGGTVKLILTEDALYCADDGQGIDETGVKALLAALRSRKQEGQIGRFGLGFKALLEITDRPQVFSFPGSFGFDKLRSQREINDSLEENFDSVPVLRQAWPLDPEKEMAGDETLAELMGWASTIIKAPLNSPDHLQFLAKELDDFPEQFLLFIEHVNSLILENRSDGIQRKRRVTRTKKDELVSLSDSSKRQSDTAWNVFTTSHKLSDEAKSDATAQHRNRGAIPITWAVSRTNPGLRGAFWTFFPSDVRTSLTGILNAPWKTSVDRANLLDGPFNRELMGVAAQLVSASLPNLLNDEDPGGILDIIPARGREEQNVLATWFVGEVYAQTANHPSIPDQHGKLQKPSDICLPPDPNTVHENAAILWSTYKERPINWSHHSVQKNDNRHSKAVRIKRIASDLDGEGPSDAVCSTLHDWLKALVATGTSEASKSAIRTASACREFARGTGGTDLESALRIVPILLTEGGELVRLRPGEAYLPPEDDMGDLKVRIVHPDLLEHRQTADILREFGIEPVAYEVLLDQLIQAGFSNFSNRVWEQFWRFAQRIPTHAAARAILGSSALSDDVNKATNVLKVRTLRGSWRILNECYLPGGVARPEYEEDTSVLIDTRIINEQLIHSLGGSENPRQGHSIVEEEWFQDYREECIEEYVNALPLGHRKPTTQLLAFQGRHMLGPISPILELSEESRVTLTEYLLNTPELFVAWRMGHSTQTSNYPLKDFKSPYTWLLKRHGLINTSRGIQPIGDCIGPRLKILDTIFPVAQISDQVATSFEIPQSYEDLNQLHWSQIMSGASSIHSIDVLGGIYGRACHHRKPPEKIRCRIGEILSDSSPSSIVATADHATFEILCQMNSPVLLVPSQEVQFDLIGKWGMVPAGDRIRTRIDYVSSSEPLPVADEYPQLIIVLNADQKSLIRKVNLVRCQTLERKTETESGEVIRPLDSYLDHDNLLISDRFPMEQVLDRVNNVLELGLSEAELQAILEDRAQDEFQQKIEQIRNLNSYPEKLLALLGRETIENRLGRNLLSTAAEIEGELTDLKIANLALACRGSAIMGHF